MALRSTDHRGLGKNAWAAVVGPAASWDRQLRGTGSFVGPAASWDRQLRGTRAPARVVATSRHDAHAQQVARRRRRSAWRPQDGWWHGIMASRGRTYHQPPPRSTAELGSSWCRHRLHIIAAKAARARVPVPEAYTMLLAAGVWTLAGNARRPHGISHGHRAKTCMPQILVHRTRRTYRMHAADETQQPETGHRRHTRPSVRVTNGAPIRPDTPFQTGRERPVRPPADASRGFVAVAAARGGRRPQSRTSNEG
ncbi:hypothetical protein DCS_01420 [Drechmeria coniospora]|uniref:Uncharacterized protein n=1 Tax=Drechmeria coniospora TaxID=98403 RepID=A0A151GT95_DRECN|nr:hypothetical protein DCS_01420 [Drechmeria coniospora]KYK60283.1 hypothetical protein DCS_01420 [Drechmeria coniospora]